jgi:hypothetical protein
MVNKIIEKFFMWGLMSNSWLWFHMLFGGVYALLLRCIDISNSFILISLFGFALLWEVYEYITDDIIKIYGSVERFLYDASGDVIGALLIAILSLC